MNGDQRNSIAAHYQGEPVAFLNSGDVERLYRVAFPGSDFDQPVELSAADILTLAAAFEDSLRRPSTYPRSLVRALRDSLRSGSLRYLLDLLLAGKKPCPACGGEGYVPSPEPVDPEDEDADGSLIPCEACAATGEVDR